MRQVILFNDDWKFYKGNAPGAEAEAFADSGWRPLALPHDWSIEGPFDQNWASGTGYLPGGIGWYRKTFSLPGTPDASQVYLHFDGVYNNSEVWINGHFLGKRPNGFISFRYDLTPYLQGGGQNIVAVKADHSEFADARWYTGSGIYRNVYLIAANPLHIGQWGVAVTTPVVSSEVAEVQVVVTAENHMAVSAEVEIGLVLRDAQNIVVAEASAFLTLLGSSEQSAAHGLTVPSPRLWSVEEPHLYTLQTTLRQNGQLLDQEETTVGIRSINFDAEEGFFLNEQNLKLKGVCLHDDAGALGVAVPPKVWERRLQILKAGGVNAIRMAHNPHMPELYDLCDRLGFLVQDEAFDEWERGKRKWIAGWNVGEAGTDGYHTHFSERGETDLRDMIRRDRNHPSIVMWSIGNEIDYPNDPYTHEVLNTGTTSQGFGRGHYEQFPHAERLGVIARRLVEVAKECDPTRPITAGLAAALISNEVGFSEALDVAGYNYQEGRYAEDHAKYPSRVIYGSENGMRWDFWAAVADNPYICGQFLWTGIDYLGEAHQWPTRSNGAGLLDLAGFPKPEYFYRQSLWAEAPMAYFGTSAVPDGREAASLWTHKQAEPVWSGRAGEPLRVLGFTNCEAAELFLNGASLGVKRLADSPDHVLWWDVAYAPGTLALHGLRHGETLCAAELKTAGAAVKIIAETDTAALAADGVDLAHLTVTVVDADGIPVYDSTADITWQVDGPARLIGLESGDHRSLEDYQVSHRRVYHGRQLGYIQATKASGPVTVTLTSPGLQEAVIALRTDAPTR